MRSNRRGRRRLFSPWRSRGSVHRTVDHQPNVILVLVDLSDVFDALHCSWNCAPMRSEYSCRFHSRVPKIAAICSPTSSNLRSADRWRDNKSIPIETDNCVQIRCTTSSPQCTDRWPPTRTGVRRPAVASAKFSAHEVFVYDSVRRLRQQRSNEN